MDFPILRKMINIKDKINYPRLYIFVTPFVSLAMKKASKKRSSSSGAKITTLTTLGVSCAR